MERKYPCEGAQVLKLQTYCYNPVWKHLFDFDIIISLSQTLFTSTYKKPRWLKSTWTNYLLHRNRYAIVFKACQDTLR